MDSKQLAISAGSAVHRDPVAATKTVIFIALMILGLFIVWKLIKGFSSFTESLSNLGGTSEQDKADILGSEDFSKAQNWLDPSFGITAIIKGKYKSAADYLIKKGFSDSMLNKTAEQIYDAKTGAYVNSAEVQSAVASMPTKAAISLMALRFNTVYGSYVGTLKTFIGKHLTVKEVSTLNSIINKKPDL